MVHGARRDVLHKRFAIAAFPAKQRKKVEDLLQIETGSLYPALHRLEAKGWIAAAWDLSEKGKRARVQATLVGASPNA